MAFGRLDRRSGPTPMSDINMTPLIDVMLVLLVILMLTAPLLSSSLKLDLPRADGAAAAGVAPPFISVALDAKGQLYLDDVALDAPGLAARVAETARQNPRTEVQLRADSSVAYGQVAELIGVVQKAGLSRIGFVTAPTAATTPAPTPR